VEFWKEKERCEPPREFRISIENLTDGGVRELTWKNPDIGVYKGTEQITLTKDTKYKLKATGGDVACGEATAELEVNVVDGVNDMESLCFEGKLSWPPCDHQGFVPFGPGVLIDHIENKTSFKIRVKKDNSPKHFVPPYQKSTTLRDWEATGIWTVGLASEIDCAIYNNLPADKRKLCVDVYLKCTCP